MTFQAIQIRFDGYIPLLTRVFLTLANWKIYLKGRNGLFSHKWVVLGYYYLNPFQRNPFQERD